MEDISTKVLARRQFVKVFSAAGLSAAFASQLGWKALAQSGPTDVDILNLALTAEYLAVDAYTNALTAGFTGEIKEYLEVAREQEEIHVKALRDTIAGPFKATPVARPMFTYGALQFTKANQMNILQTMVALETAFTGAYLGAIPLIANKDVLAAAAAIAMNEEAHLTLIRDSILSLGGKVDGPQVPNGRAFGVPITPAQATSAVMGFIKK